MAGRAKNDEDEFVTAESCEVEDASLVDAAAVARGGADGDFGTSVVEPLSRPFVEGSAERDAQLGMVEADDELSLTTSILVGVTPRRTSSRMAAARSGASMTGEPLPLLPIVV